MYLVVYSFSGAKIQFFYISRTSKLIFSHFQIYIYKDVWLQNRDILSLFTTLCQQNNAPKQKKKLWHATCLKEGQNNQTNIINN